MKTSEFCKIAAAKLVKDFIDSEIIGEDDAFGVEFVIGWAMEAAAQHALLGVASSIKQALDATDLMPDSATEDQLVVSLKEMHPHR